MGLEEVGVAFLKLMKPVVYADRDNMKRITTPSWENDLLST